jgi:hypothetical protein
MKKPKLSLGPGGMKGLLIRHIEKIVFGVTILLVLVFVFLGYRLESKLAGRTPDKLQSLATTAVTNIQRSSAAALESERTPREGKGGRYFARVQGIAPLDPLVYSLKPWNQPLGSPNSKREDPEIFAPIKLETTPLTGALCVRAEEGEESLLAKLENAPAPEKKKEKSKDKGRKKSPGAGGLGHGDSNPYGDENFGGLGSGPGGYPGMDDNKDDKKKKDDRPRGPERRYPETKVCGYRPSGSGTSGSSGMMPGLGMPGMGIPGSGMPGPGMPGVGMPGVGMPGVGMPSTGGSDPRGSGPAMGGMGIPSTGAPGMGMPGAPGGGYMGGAGSTVTVAGQPIATSANVIIVKALVPYRKQADEYKRVLGEALGYDPMRDQPRIVFFQAQRVDVTDDPQKEIQEADWQLVMTPKTAQTKAKEQRWHGVMPEVADYNYVDSNATMPVLPMMLRCMDKAMLHSEVPRGKTMAAIATTVDDDEKKKKDDAAGKKEGADGGLDLPGGMPGAGAVGGGFLGPGMGDTRGSGYPGMGGGLPGTGYPGVPGSGYPGMGGMMPGTTGPGAGGYGGSYAAAELVQYKLIRFCDTDVEPGKVYRYRVRVFLEDPNNPNTDPTNGIVNVPPRRRSLSMKVIDRLNKQEADEASKKSYYVLSPWSDATQPVSLPSTARLYTGAVEPQRMAAGGEGAAVQQSEVYGNLVPVVWNDQLAIDVSTETRGYRGSVLNFTKKQFDVLDPVSLVIKILKGYEFKNQFMVLDIRGGEDLPGDRKELVTAPGEFALVDDTGNFRVLNELDDYKEFRRYSFADELVSSSPGSGMGSGGMMPGTGYPGGGMPDLSLPGTGAPGMPGMPGAAGDGGGRKRGRR